MHDQAFSTGQNKLILQESCTDPSGALVVYCPVPLPAIKAVMSGEDPSILSLSPSGFVISGAMSGGALVTVLLQMSENSATPGSMSLESANLLNTCVGITIDKLKAALSWATSSSCRLHFQRCYCMDLWCHVKGDIFLWSWLRTLEFLSSALLKQTYCLMLFHLLDFTYFIFIRLHIFSVPVSSFKFYYLYLCIICLVFFSLGIEKALCCCIDLKSRIGLKYCPCVHE